MLTALVCWLLSFLPPGSISMCTEVARDPLLLAASSLAPDLQFPSESSALSSSDIPRMTLYKPEGNGPYPGLVLFHQCAGLGNSRRPNLSMAEWPKESVARGYVALLIDSLGPRGIDTVCYGPKGGVNFPRGVKDALQAAEHLRSFDFVDKKRIALAGYSWGAMVGILASSKRWGTTLAPGQRFAAVISFYPGCRTITPQSGKPYEIVQPDIDRPLLALMGELDNETPPGECIAKLDGMKAGGAPLEWHVYPETTHCWDCRQLDQFSKVDVRGNQVTYRYNEEVTRDSARRMFEFLERTMKIEPERGIVAN
jgi:dienelactone hydrolase